MRPPNKNMVRHLSLFFMYFKSLCYKELKQIIRDPGSLLLAFVLPTILLFIFGYGINFNPKKLELGIVNQQNNNLTTDLTSAFSNSKFFKVTLANNTAELTPELVNNTLKGILVIDNSFSSNFYKQQAAKIQLLVDGSAANISSYVENYAQGVIQNWATNYQLKNAAAPKEIISTQPHYQYNSKVESSYSLIPGSMVIIISLVGTLLTSLVVAREWEHGTMESIMSTPVTPVALLLSKIFMYFLLAISAATLCLLLSIFLFKVPFKGSIFAFYLLITAFLLPGLGQGLLISSITKNQFMAAQLAILSGFMPAVMLSDFIFPLESMPTWIQYISYVIPAKYLLPCLQTVFLTGDIWPLFLKNIAIMLGVGLAIFILSAKTTRKRLD